MGLPTRKLMFFPLRASSLTQPQNCQNSKKQQVKNMYKNE